MLRFLEKPEIEDAQKEGYMCEHVLLLYSTVAYQTALYNDNFPVFIGRYDQADVILFGLKDRDEDRLGCVRDLAKTHVKFLNVATPEPLNILPNTELKLPAWISRMDYHIDVNQFDLNLKGRKYKSIRYRVSRAEKSGYRVKIGRDLTSSHVYLLAKHMTRHKYDAWEYEEMLSLERFFKEHNHGLMIEVYQEDKLLGFDVIDFLENKRIMVAPLGIYLKAPGVADFLMYEELKYAKENCYEWLDVGSDCGEPKLRQFKEKWFAKPKYRILYLSVKLN